VLVAKIFFLEGEEYFGRPQSLLQESYASLTKQSRPSFAAGYFSTKTDHPDGGSVTGPNMTPERLNDDLSLLAIMHGADLSWVASPLPGVERRPLYRLGGEQARATSLVRYAPGSHFSTHLHSGGEEFLVIEGVFEDENGSYPAGSYVRNPPGSGHTPGAREGCMIFVRLRQFHVDDREQIVAEVSGQSDQLLFQNPHENVWIQTVQASSRTKIVNPRGLELLVLDGTLVGEGFLLQPLSWMRLPSGIPFEAEAGGAGARLWLKDAVPTLGF
jgi:quercetin dioxygenase-like cupin family protein